MNTVDIYGDKKVLIDILNDEFEGEYVDDTIITIRDNLFRDCAGLTSIKLANVTSIGENAFMDTGVTQLTSVNLPKVTSMSANAFKNCVDLETVNLPTVTSMSGTVFYGCTKLTEDTVRLPNYTGNSNIFNGCTGIKKITPEVWPMHSIARGSLTGTTCSVYYLPYITSYDLDCISNSANSNRKVIRLPNCTTGGNFSLACSPLRLVDVLSVNGGSLGSTEWWSADSGVRIIILRSQTLISLSSLTGNFVANSTFNPNKYTGGVDIYVPSALVSSYENATNWSALADPNGSYNTARFHALEGSKYENHNYSYDEGLNL